MTVACETCFENRKCDGRPCGALFAVAAELEEVFSEEESDVTVMTNPDTQARADAFKCDARNAQEQLHELLRENREMKAEIDRLLGKLYGRCEVCDSPIEEPLGRLGSLTCSEHRPANGVQYPGFSGGAA